ncbi:MAG: pyruvoyl-dependent arginine decarboxylase, partial [Promethearchaeota archaeon]
MTFFRFKPTKAWLSGGTGLSATSKLNAFDKALVDAGVGHLNLIKYSSILPKGIVFEDFLENLEAGQATGVIMATANGSEKSTIAAAIGVVL